MCTFLRQTTFHWKQKLCFLDWNHRGPLKVREWFAATMRFSEKTAVQREILAARTALRLSSSSTAESCEKGRTCVQTRTSEGRTAAKVSECHPRSSIWLAGTARARALLLGKLEAQKAGKGRSHSQTS